MEEFVSECSCLGGICGNGEVEILQGEECDDGNVIDGDGCSRLCKIEQSWDCSFDTSLGENVCKFAYAIDIA